MLTSPQIEKYIEYFDNGLTDIKKLNKDSEKLLLKLFGTIKPIKNTGRGETTKRDFMFFAPKGSFEEYKRLFDDEDEESLKNWFENERGRWYNIQFRSLDAPWYPGPYYGVYINNFYVLALNDRNEKDWPEEDATDFIAALIEIAASVIQDIKAGTYNDYINKNLTYDMRYGRISRKDYWEKYPKEKSLYSFTPHEIEILKSAGNESVPPKTAREFYEMCAVCYKAIGLEATNSRFEDSEEEHERYGNVTPKEMYYRYADGRDDGLMSVALDDEEDFQKWLQHKEPYAYSGGHPFEIIFSYSGMKSVHLYIFDDEVTLSGGDYPANVMAARMYVGLVDNGYSVRYSATSILDRIEEKDDIGILPSYIWTNNYFKDVYDTINLTDDMYVNLKDKIRWEPIPEVLLDEK